MWGLEGEARRLVVSQALVIRLSKIPAHMTTAAGAWETKRDLLPAIPKTRDLARPKPGEEVREGKVQYGTVLWVLSTPTHMRQGMCVCMYIEYIISLA